ncbi:restriction endonuclease subunit S [Aquidulcibacter sp.]|uniref:restriction endonuclease subunit S n=1 Tax=Aquidulcibacter sp. TaxID=2052990 RepID=UPI0025BB70E1|nr:restriction endonuclease subunit S [Aquidulcibacter sp.]MCA3694387.1 restriction endonuclease subunit S [Aquidulcibacter sp.]
MNELPSGWAEVPLGAFSTKTRNIDPASHLDSVFELYSVPAYQNGKPDVVAGAEIGSTKQIVLPGDVLLCKIIPHLNRVWAIPETYEHDQIASPEWLVYRDHGCLPEFLRAALSEPSFRELFLQTKSGVGGSLTRARTELVNQINLKIAPIEEQRRIVAKVDRLMARTTRARKELDRIPTLIARYKQRLLALAFSGELTADWRDTSAQVNKGATWDGLGQIPESWTWREAESLCHWITKGTTPKAEALSSEAGEVPFIKVYNLTFDGSLNFKKTPTFVNQNTHLNELNRSRVFPGDVLMNIVGPPLGKVSIVPDDYPEWNINQAIAIFRTKKEITGAYLSHWLLSEGYLNWALANSKATAGQRNLTLEICRRSPVPLAPLSEQAEIVRRIETAFSWLDRLAMEHTSATKLLPKLDAAILTKAFRGELVPQDPNDEPASVLLERVKAERDGELANSRTKKVKAKLPTISAKLDAQLGEISLDATAAVRRSKSESIQMKKSRTDEDVQGQPYLAQKLQQLIVRVETNLGAEGREVLGWDDVLEGPFFMAELFKLADLTMEDFYKQVIEEIEAGYLAADIGPHFLRVQI